MYEEPPSESLLSSEEPIYGLQNEVKEERTQIFAHAMKEAYERPNDQEFEPSLLSSRNPYSRTSLEALAAAIPDEPEKKQQVKKDTRPTLIGDVDHERNFNAHFQVNSTILNKTRENIETFLTRKIEHLKRARKL